MRLTGGNDRMKRIKMGKIQLAGKLERAITMSSLRHFFEGWSVLLDRCSLRIQPFLDVFTVDRDEYSEDDYHDSDHIDVPCR